MASKQLVPKKAVKPIPVAPPPKKSASPKPIKPGGGGIADRGNAVSMSEAVRAVQYPGSNSPETKKYYTMAITELETLSGVQAAGVAKGFLFYGSTRRGEGDPKRQQMEHALPEKPKLQIPEEELPDSKKGISIQNKDGIKPKQIAASSGNPKRRGIFPPIEPEPHVDQSTTIPGANCWELCYYDACTYGSINDTSCPRSSRTPNFNGGYTEQFFRCRDSCWAQQQEEARQPDLREQVNTSILSPLASGIAEWFYNAGANAEATLEFWGHEGAELVDNFGDWAFAAGIALSLFVGPEAIVAGGLISEAFGAASYSMVLLDMTVDQLQGQTADPNQFEWIRQNLLQDMLENLIQAPFDASD